MNINRNCFIKTQPFSLIIQGVSKIWSRIWLILSPIFQNISSLFCNNPSFTQSPPIQPPPTSKIETSSPSKKKTRCNPFDWEKIGKAEIEHKYTKEKVSIVIEKQIQEETEVYRAKNSKGRSIGHIRIQYIEEKKGKFYSKNANGELAVVDNQQAKGYGPEQERISFLWISHIKSDFNEKYRGVGTALMQTAIEASFFKGYKGRVAFTAVNDSHGFYFKQGFKTTSSEEDQRLQKIIEETDGKYSAVARMYLPQENIKEWEQKIQKAPIIASNSFE